jgi:NAD-dependent dihydropyrimidine dehydrogenase PreA subunit
MAYVITEACVDIRDRSCVNECPVDCIYEGNRQFYIHPDECIDCGACELVCPEDAIVFEEDLLDGEQRAAERQRELFASLGVLDGARQAGPLNTDHPEVAVLPARAAGN